MEAVLATSVVVYSLEVGEEVPLVYADCDDLDDVADALSAYPNL